MMRGNSSEAGFSAVELLITLFVAVAFLVAGYQLFDVVIRNGGEARAESRAANVAYSHLRQYSESATNPCAPSSPLASSPVTVDGLTDVTVSIFITCPQQDAPSISKVEAIIEYGELSKELRYATFVDKSRNVAASSDVTDGLANQWRLNGTGAPAAGNMTLSAINGASPANNTYGQANTAYSFSTAGAFQYLSGDQATILGNTNATVSLWVYSATGTNSGAFIKLGSASNGYGIGIGNATYANATPGTNIILAYEGVRWINTSTALGTGWHHIVMTINSAGVPSAYRDGVPLSSYAGTNAATPTAGISVGGAGTSARFSGSVDDVRLYSRALSAAEVLQLYQAGPK